MCQKMLAPGCDCVGVMAPGVGFGDAYLPYC